MSKKKDPSDYCVFKKPTRNDFIVDFLKNIEGLFINQNTDIQYIGIMLVDQTCGAEIPKYTGNDSTYSNCLAEKYHPCYKNDLETRVNDIFNYLKNHNLPPLNSILLNKLNSTSKDKTIILKLNSISKDKTIILSKIRDRNPLSVDVKDYNFLNDKNIIFNEVFMTGIIEKEKKNIINTFEQHFSFIDQLNGKDGNLKNYYLLFYPINYEFIKIQTLMYITFVGRTNYTDSYQKTNDICANITGNIGRYISIVKNAHMSC